MIDLKKIPTRKMPYSFYFQKLGETLATMEAAQKIDGATPLKLKEKEMDAMQDFMDILNVRFGESWSDIWDSKKKSPEQVFESTTRFMIAFFEDLAMQKSLESAANPEEATQNAYFSRGLLFAAAKANQLMEIREKHSKIIFKNNKS